MKQVLKTTSYLLFFLLIFQSCKKIIDSVGSSGIDKVSVEDLKKIDVNNIYSISIPDYMSEMKSLNEDASLQYANIFKETYTIVIDENKQDFINAFKNAEIYNDSISPLKNYVDFQVNSITENVEDGKSNKSDAPLRIKNASQYEITGKIDGIDISYLIGFVEGKENMFMMMSWTTKNRFKKYKNTFNLIHNSLKLKQ